MIFGVAFFDNEIELTEFKALYGQDSGVSIEVCIHLTEEQIINKIKESGERKTIFLVITTDEAIKKMLIRKSATASKYWLDKKQNLQSQVLKVYDWAKWVPKTRYNHRINISS